MSGTSTATLTQPQSFPQTFSLSIDESPAVEFRVPPNASAGELSADHLKELHELKADLARLEIPRGFFYKLEDHLTVVEKEKLALFKVIETGLEESATIFQPRRYRAWSDERRDEALLWLRAFWCEGVQTAAEAKCAFARHLSEGHKFPRPADILKLVRPVSCPQPADAQRRRCD